MRTCGACYQKGDVLADCTRKVDVFGFLVGCPVCNTTKHNVDQCKGQTQSKRRGKKPMPSILSYYMVVRRIGKPPLRSGLDFRFINPEKWAALDRYPQTCQFAAYRRKKKIIQGVEENVDDPHWTDPNTVKSRIHHLEGNITSVPSTFTRSSSPARIFNQRLPEERHLAQQRTSSHGPAAPTPKDELTSGALLLPSPSRSGTMLRDYHGQSSAAQPKNILGNQQNRERNQVVPPAVPQFFSIPTQSPSLVYNRFGVWGTHPPAQSEKSHCEAHEAFNVPHSEKPSFSEVGQSELKIQLSRDTLSQSLTIPCENLVNLPTTGLPATNRAREARKWAIRLRNVPAVREHCARRHLWIREISISE